MPINEQRGERARVFPKALDFGFGGLFVPWICSLRSARRTSYMGTPVLNCGLLLFRIQGSPSVVLTDIGPAPSRFSIPSFCR
jgi:hypothetical protein